MHIEFESIAERRECHRNIQEAAQEIEDATELLEVLFELENGKDDSQMSGFEWIRLNDPTATYVNFNGFGTTEFLQLLETLEERTAADLGDAEDEQLATLADNLSETAAIIREGIPADDHTSQ